MFDVDAFPFLIHACPVQDARCTIGFTFLHRKEYLEASPRAQSRNLGVTVYRLPRLGGFDQRNCSRLQRSLMGYCGFVIFLLFLGVPI